MSVKFLKTGVVQASGETNPNLMPNSYIMPLGTSNATTGTWRLAGSNSMTKSRVLIQNDMYGFQNEGIQTPNDGSCYGIDNFNFEPNTNYIISMWARMTSGSGGKAGYSIQNVEYVDGSHTSVEKNYHVTPLSYAWTRCWLQFKTNSTANRNIYIGIVTGDTNVTTQMCLIKIEKGTTLTPWCPMQGDADFVAPTSGFNEYNGVAQITKGQVNAMDFIEI